MPLEKRLRQTCGITFPTQGACTVGENEQPGGNDDVVAEIEEKIAQGDATRAQSLGAKLSKLVES